jgi:phage tail-like protein
MMGSASSTPPRRVRRWMANRARLVRRLALATALAAVGVTAFATAGFGQLTGDPITANRFALTVDGVEIATFQELSSIAEEVDPTNYWTSTDPTKVKPPTVILKRGLTGSMELWAWHEAVRRRAAGQARRSATLVMYSPEGQPVARYWLEKAWPMKIDLAGLKAGSSEALVETVTLTAERIQRIAP